MIIHESHENKFRSDPGIGSAASEISRVATECSVSDQGPYDLWALKVDLIRGKLSHDDKVLNYFYQHEHFNFPAVGEGQLLKLKVAKISRQMVFKVSLASIQ